MSTATAQEYLTLDEFKTGDKIALMVTGESMIEEHIADGDFVIIRKQRHARNGQVAAIRDDTGEVCLMRYFKEDGRIRLEPGNKAMRAVYREKVQILGVLVGVVRKY